MYQAIHYNYKSNYIHLLDDKKGYIKFPFKRYAYKLTTQGTHTTLYGAPCKKVNGWSPEDLENQLIYESDINPEIRTLVDMYLEDDSIATNHNIMHLDIEVSGEGGNCLATEATNEITAISFYATRYDEEIILLLDKESLFKNSVDGKTSLFSYSNERDLLIGFIKSWKKYMPTIVTGWNIDEYDIPYICNRIIRVLTQQYLNNLSPFGEVIYDSRSTGWKITGVNCLDLMRLYKKYTPNEKSSYALDVIAKEELGYGKFEHEYGSLQKLYEKNPKQFIEYNITDVRLTVALDKKLQYIEQTLAICHDSHIPYESIYATSVSLDAAALVFLHRNNMVAPNKPPRVSFQLADDYRVGETKLYLAKNIPTNFPRVGILKIWKSKSVHFKVEYTNIKNNCIFLKEPLQEQVLKEFIVNIQLVGAFVKDPVPGIYKWLFDLDLASLYPSIIMTLNISPETKFGRILNWNVEEYYSNIEKDYRIQYVNGKEQKYNLQEFKSLIIEGNKYSIAANGTMYRLDKKGVLPIILEKWFSERSQFKKYRDEAFENGEMAKYKLYDQKQYTKKIQLNSFYGALALTVFRYYDIDNAEAVTSTGRSIIQFTQKCSNQYYNSILKTDKIDYVTYCDTDSAFSSAEPILEKMNIDHSNIEVMIEETVKIATAVQDYINSMYSKFAVRNLFVKTHKLKIKQENVALSGIWVAKKRYALMMVLKEGNRVNKLAVTGIDVIRSDFPKLFQNVLSTILTNMLNLKPKEDINKLLLDMKNNLKKSDLSQVMFSIGVKNVEEYSKKPTPFIHLKGAPAQVKAAINHNDFIKYKNITSDIIRSNSKIKWTYLVKNPFNIESIALKGYDDPPEIISYINTYLDYEKVFFDGFVSKVQVFYDAAGWDQIQLNENVDMFFKF